jgi:hypothetical protein
MIDTPSCLHCGHVHLSDKRISLDEALPYGVCPSCPCRTPSYPRQPEKQREGDQPLPKANDLPGIQDLVLADIEERKKIGIKRYGHLVIYLRKQLYERDGK